MAMLSFKRRCRFSVDNLTFILSKNISKNNRNIAQNYFKFYVTSSKLILYGNPAFSPTKPASRLPAGTGGTPREQGAKKESRHGGSSQMVIRMRGRRKLLPPDILNRIQIGSAYEKTIYLNTITECKADFVHKNFLRLRIL